MHIDAYGIGITTILAQPGEGNFDHPIYFSSRKISTVEWNYTMNEHKGLEMVYFIDMFFHYILGGNFNFFTNHSTLKYLVNMLMLEGRTCWWLLLFLKFSFVVTVKLGWTNVGPYHLSHLEWGEYRSFIEYQIPDVDQFRVEAAQNYLEYITLFLATSKCLNDYFSTSNRNLVVRKPNY